MKKAYVSCMTTDDFLPGMLVVQQSLREEKATEELVVLVTAAVTEPIRTCLRTLGARVLEVELILNPNDNPQNARYKDCYTKLRAFGLVDYQKIVLLDADLLICDNLDCLFDKPGWSAVNAGGLLPDYSHWVELNSGLMVIEPDQQVFSSMLHSREALPSKEGGDQGFLHSFFPDWPTVSALHLDHRYNVATDLLERYCNELAFCWPKSVRHTNKQRIAVLHFWGPDKPWLGRIGVTNARTIEAYKAWWACFHRACKVLYPYSLGDEVPAKAVQSVMNHLHQVVNPIPHTQFLPLI